MTLEELNKWYDHKKEHYYRHGSDEQNHPELFRQLESEYKKRVAKVLENNK